jgi:hypothetical protein
MKDGKFALTCTYSGLRIVELGRFQYSREAEAAAQAHYDRHNSAAHPSGTPFGTLLTWRNDTARRRVTSGDAGIIYTIEFE